MVYKRGKRIELRKRKETEKEKKIKARKKQIKDMREDFQSYELSLVIALLLVANLIFLLSIGIHTCTPRGTSRDLVTPPSSLNEESGRRILKVEVLNGCGVDGVAKKLAEYLREKNIDVVDYRNFESKEISETLVIDRKDYKMSNARVIGRIIGVEENRMFPQLRPMEELPQRRRGQLDVTIIIGKNYLDLRAFQ